MAFQASRAKSGLFEIHGLEEFIEQKVAELKLALGLIDEPKASKKLSGGAGKTRKRRKATNGAAMRQPGAGGKTQRARGATPAGNEEGPLSQVLEGLEAHPRKAELIEAGKRKNQLLRSLIPLYLARGSVEISSGTTSKFWARCGVTYAAPNAAKALRQHPGYSKRTAQGPRITQTGVKYVEKALADASPAPPAQ